MVFPWGDGMTTRRIALAALVHSDQWQPTPQLAKS
jgi:hypothetical protein